MYPRIVRLICTVLCLLTAPLVFGASSNPKAKSGDTPKAKSSAKIDVNTADAATLETLPGVGPATARAIIAARPFASIDELESVPGIGPGRMADLRDHVRVSRVPASSKASPKAASKAGTVAAEKKSERAKEVATQRTESAGRVGKSREATPAESAGRVSKSREAVPTEGFGRASKSRETTPPTIARQDRPLEPTGFPSTPRRSTAPDVTSTAGMINLNTATKEQLEALPEIGPVKAQAIIDARPFSTIEDVMRVKGIKEGTFEAIRDRITVR